MEWYHVYLFTRLDGLISFFEGVSLITLLFAVCACIAWVPVAMEELDNYKPILTKITIVSVSLCFMGGIMKLAIPTQKEAAAIYLLPKLANSNFAQEAQQIPTDAAKLMRLKLESWIADMEPKKAK